MKLLQIACFCALMCLSISCKDTPKDPAGEQNREVTEEIVTDPVTPTVAPVDDTQKTSDWVGSYSGVSPCADCPGMKTDITLNSDNTYSLEEQYLEKEKAPRRFKGSFTWDDTKSVITMDAEGDHHKFKVMDGKVTLLDKFGDPKQGGKPEDFVLQKVK